MNNMTNELRPKTALEKKFKHIKNQTSIFDQLNKIKSRVSSASISLKSNPNK